MCDLEPFSDTFYLEVCIIMLPLVFLSLRSEGIQHWGAGKGKESYEA